METPSSSALTARHSGGGRRGFSYPANSLYNIQMVFIKEKRKGSFLESEDLRQSSAGSVVPSQHFQGRSPSLSHSRPEAAQQNTASPQPAG